MSKPAALQLPGTIMERLQACIGMPVTVFLSGVHGDLAPEMPGMPGRFPGPGVPCPGQGFGPGFGSGFGPGTGLIQAVVRWGPAGMARGFQPDDVECQASSEGPCPSQASVPGSDAPCPEPTPRYGDDDKSVLQGVLACGDRLYQRERWCGANDE